MRPTVYIETSVIGYLTSRPSRDVVVLAKQQLTRAWWDRAPDEFDLVVSPLVLQECGRGDPTAAAERLAAIAELPVLPTLPAAEPLAEDLVAATALPSKAAADATHIAIAAVHGVDFLLSWNCTHITNATTWPKINAVCRRAGYEPAILCTPLELGFGE